VRNLQLVFGFNPQPDHWGSRVTVYFIAFAVLVLLFWSIRRLLAEHKRASSLIVSAIIAFILVILSVGQIIKAQSIYSQDASFLDKDMADSFEWINKNTEPNSVFLTDADITRTSLSFYTHANVYLPHACLSLASNGEILERYGEVYALYGVPASMVKDFFEKKWGRYTDIQLANLDADFSMFCLAYKVKGGTPRGVIDEFIEKYKIRKSGIRNLNYRADYLFYGPYERAISDFNAADYPELKLAYSNNSVKIYKIIKE